MLSCAVVKGAVTLGVRIDTIRDGVIDLTGDTDVHGKTNWTEASGEIPAPPRYRQTIVEACS